jgi:hypothetical protein
MAAGAVMVQGREGGAKYPGLANQIAQASMR